MSIPLIIGYILGGLILYTYLGYPLLLWWTARRSNGATNRINHNPRVTVVLSVYNEAERIRARIENLLRSQYPLGRVQILVGSDGSSDGTNEVLRSIEDPHVRVFMYDDRRGKAAVLNDLLPSADGEIVVFTDANTEYALDCIAALVRPFGDPSVGGVCGELRLRPEREGASGSNESFYWAYESFIKRREGAVASTIGATGAVFAVRRELVRSLPTDRVLADDLMQSLHVIDQGYRFVYEAGALAFESPAAEVKGEMRRRIRIGAGNVAALKPYLRLLDPRRGWVALSLWSHKVLRWSVPFLAAIAFTALGLARIMQGLGPADAAIAGIAAAWFLLGWWLDRTHRAAGIGGWLYYGTMINLGLGIGIVWGLFGRLQPAWEKVARSDRPMTPDALP